eukprot:COSAG06_NODE_659_length_13318_cov_37.619941_6_plen_83_part_00
MLMFWGFIPSPSQDRENAKSPLSRCIPLNTAWLDAVGMGDPAIPLAPEVDVGLQLTIPVFDCKKTHIFLCSPYACPEPVLEK